MSQAGFSPTVLAALLVFLHNAPAQAFNAKSWVSNAGSDANPCTLASPCASLQIAHNQTNSGGEIGVLNAGDYGALPLFILKSINITNDGSGEAAIRVLGTGITIDGGAGDIVSLRGLVLDGMISGLNGIVFNTGAALHIQNCVIRNLENEGPFALAFMPQRNSQLFVSDTIIFNNGTGAFTGGILIQPRLPAGRADVVLDRVRVENNVDGLLIDGRVVIFGAGSHVVVRESVFSGNAANGIHAVTFEDRSPAFVYVERTSIVDNGQNGILADGAGATILLSDSTVTRNAVGIAAVHGGQLISYRNNRINNNTGPDGTPTGFDALN